LGISVIQYKEIIMKTYNYRKKATAANTVYTELRDEDRDGILSQLNDVKIMIGAV